MTDQAEIVRRASQHLNLEIGLARRSDQWVGGDYWEGATDTTITLEEVLARSEVVAMGADGGGLNDLLGLAVLGCEKLTWRWLLWSRAWANPSVLARRKTETSILRDFERAGELVVCKELGDDIVGIAALASRINEGGLLHAVGSDPFGVGAIIDALAEAGISGQDKVVGISQGWKLSGAIKTMERKLAAGTLHHSGQNATVRRRQHAAQRRRRGLAIVGDGWKGRQPIGPAGGRGPVDNMAIAAPTFGQRVAPIEIGSLGEAGRQQQQDDRPTHRRYHT